MTAEQQFILDTLRTVFHINSQKMDTWKNAELNTDEIVRIIRINGIVLTVYAALDDFPSIQGKLYESYYAGIAQSLKQEYEGKQILQSLNSAGIDCIALKGWELRKLYPQVTMRQMSDLDILVQKYDSYVIEKLMVSLGFTALRKSSAMHDEYSKDSVTAEMHKRLADDSEEIQEWEKEMWRHTVPSGEGIHILRMTDEDYYIFHLIHMHADILRARLGLRRIVDTWLFTGTHPEMDNEYIDCMLNKMGLALFRKRMETLGRGVMGETEIDENSKIMLSAAFQYGINGSAKSYQLGRIMAVPGENLNRRKVHALFYSLFAPYKTMSVLYPTLKK